MPAASAPAPYFTPEFFSPFYFPPLSAPQVDATAVGYFSPHFFTPFYFPPYRPVLVEPPPPTPAPTYRDRDALASIAGALRGTGEFQAVFVGISADARPAGADLTPVAVVTPRWWEERDDADPTVVVRQVAYSITLIVRNDDPAEGYDALDRLSCAALNAVNGSDLGGCLPPLTRLGRGVFEPDAVFPEHRVVLSGEFTYLIPSPSSHSTTP